MLVDILEIASSFLDRKDIINCLKSGLLTSSSRLICNICSYRKHVEFSDDIYTLEYIYNYCLGKYHLKKSLCGVYIDGVCDHCSKVKGKLKF